MFKLNSAVSRFSYLYNKGAEIEKSQDVSNPSDDQKYFITGTLDSDKIVRSFLPRVDQLNWRLFSRGIHEMLDPISVIVGRIYPQNEDKHLNITSFLISPCGRYLFLGMINDAGNASVLKILDFNTRVVLKELIIKRSGPREGLSHIRINSIIMCPCGKKFVTHAGDASEAEIFVWDLNTTKKLLSFSGTSFMLSSCGSKIATNGYSVLTIWDANTGFKLHEFGNIYSVSAISSFAISLCGKKFIIAFNSGVVKVLDFETKTECYHLFIKERPINFIVVSPCGTKFLTHSRSGVIKIFDLDTGAKLYEFGGKENIIISFAVTPCGKKLVTVLANGFVKIWDFMTGTELRKFFVCRDPMMSLQISPCGKKIIVLTRQHKIQTWSIEEKLFSPDDPAFIKHKKEQNRNADCSIQ